MAYFIHQNTLLVTFSLIFPAPDEFLKIHGFVLVYSIFHTSSPLAPFPFFHLPPYLPIPPFPSYPLPPPTIIPSLPLPRKEPGA